MSPSGRGRFSKLGAGSGAAARLTSSIARAARIPGNHRTRSLRDVEHVVVLMQENRSFDHYFGTLRGVRGFGDPHPATLPSGRSVFHQPDGDREVLPFHPDVPDAGSAFLRDLDHEWESGHDAINHGVFDRWVPAKTAATMAYLTREDIPFHYALADAFTVCDAYHCSLLGPTDPNRYYLWTGSSGGAGTGGGPVIANDQLGYTWTTYPERLQQAGIDWKIYQDVGNGLDRDGSWGWTDNAYIGNYGDNALLYFTQYQDARPGDPLYDRARTGTDHKAGQDLFDVFRADIAAGTLPAVSWVVAPEAYSEHPNWPANYGAWYIAQILDALTADPQVWSRTALFITYDENDGFFDHVVAPYAPTTPADGASTVDTAQEIYRGQDGMPGATLGQPGPYGLGQRVPMIVASPWSRGGFVTSELLDHTSIIRFIEQRFGVTEPGISPWRRAVCGDLTSAFDFTGTDDRVPTLPSVTAYAPAAHVRHPDVDPVPPVRQSAASQEPGVRPTRPSPYDLHVTSAVDAQGATLTLHNRGRTAAVFHTRMLGPVVRVLMFTVEAHREITVPFAATGAAGYAVEVHGPDGFFRRFTGSTGPGPEVSVAEHAGGRHLLVTNSGPAVELTVLDHHHPSRTTGRPIEAGGHLVLDVGGRDGWYDLEITSSGDPLFCRRIGGHLPTGRPGTSDPRLGRDVRRDVSRDHGRQIAADLDVDGRAERDTVAAERAPAQ